MLINSRLKRAALEVFTTATLPSAANYPFRIVFNSDTKQELVSDGTNWIPTGSLIVSPNGLTTTTLKRPNGGASYDLTVPNDLPGSTSLLEMTATGQVQYSSTFPPGTPPTYQIFDTPGAISYTPPTPAPLYIKVKMVGGGGGGGGTGTTTTTDGLNGQDTVFDSIVAGGGSRGLRAQASSAGGQGGAGGVPGSGATFSCIGGPGQSGNLQFSGVSAQAGGAGGGSYFGTGGSPIPGSGGGVVNSGPYGAGGSGGSSLGTANVSTAGGGGAGAYVELILPSGSYSGTVGNGGAGGSNGTLGTAGGNGSPGIIIVEEYYT